MKVEMKLGGSRLSIETGKVAKQADGAVWVQYGETVVLVTAVASRREHTLDFFPLTVDFRERGYAAGKIPTIYGRREPRPGVLEQLTARLIDHCIRPLFPKDFKYEVQVMCTVLSHDKIHGAEVPALIGASAALSLSDIPFNGPVGAITVGQVDGEFIVNPSIDLLDECDLEFFVSGNSSAVMSVEGHAHEASENEVIDAITFAHSEIKEIIRVQEGIVAVCGKTDREYEVREIDEALRSQVAELATEKIAQSIGMSEKEDRADFISKLKTEATEKIVAHRGSSIDEDELKTLTGDVGAIIKELEKSEMRRSILEEGKRVDGRAIDEVRKISSEVALLPRAHGSALFSRGQTQALCTVTLGSSGDEDSIRTISGDHNRPFYLHYNFPPYSTGEVKRLMGPGRREIGHGFLAEKALAPMIPSKEDFNYTIRIVSEILESNASSSMASVCGATLALMDAGVPIVEPVAGVGVGLIKEGDKEVLLSDMVGTEDFLGDMDFKVAGTRNGITAIQMDIKIDGITTELLQKAVYRAKSAREFVLDKMAAVIAEPREELSPHAPRIYTLKIPVSKIKDLIGPRGKVVQGIQEDTGVTISIEDDGRVEIASTSSTAAAEAEEQVVRITAVPEVGKEYLGKVVRTTAFGAFVEILPGQDGLIHISKMGDGYVREVEDIMNVGDELEVCVIKVDDGRVDLAIAGDDAPSDPRPRHSDRHSDDRRSTSRPPRNSRSGRSSSSRRPRSGGGDSRGRRSHSSDRPSSRSRSVRIPKRT